MDIEAHAKQVEKAKVAILCDEDAGLAPLAEQEVISACAYLDLARAALKRADILQARAINAFHNRGY